MNIRADAVTQEKPPFRAEHIGSLLRPSTLLQKRERFAHREISQADLTAAEDAAISDAVVLQEQLGLRLATDGEFRRRSYHSFFYQQLGNVSIDTVPAPTPRLEMAMRGGASSQLRLSKAA
jgi:5-methyltetrahydropteroyltriglutamate--homocysteine methyltransferase